MDDAGALWDSVVGFGLAGAPPWPVPVAVSDEDWQPLFVRARNGKVLGQLVRAVAGGLLEIGDKARAELAEAHEAAMSRALQLEAQLLALGEDFDAHGIDWRLLKGSASAHLLYDDPAERTFVDIDVLVPSASFAAAVEVTGGLGATRSQPSLGSDYERRFTKSVTMRTPAGEIDLHRTLAPGPYGLAVDEADLYAERATFALAGREVPTVTPPVALVHACYHAVLGDVAASDSTRRDIAILAADPDLDVVAVGELAARWRGVSVVAEGLALARPLAPHAAWPVVHEIGRRPARRIDRYLRRAYVQRRGRFGRQAIASLAVLPTWRDRASLARSVVWPGRANLDRRGLTRRAHLRRMLRRP